MRSKGQIMNTKYLSKMTYWPCYIIIYIFSIFLTFYYLCINLWFRNPIEIYEVLLYTSTNKFSFIANDIKTNFSSTYTFYNILLGLSAVYLYVQIIPLFIYVNKDSISKQHLNPIICCKLLITLLVSSNSSVFLLFTASIV